MNADAGVGLNRLPRWRFWTAGKDATREPLAEEQLRIVWQHASFGLVMATAFAIVLAIYLERQLGTEWVHAWLVAKIGVPLLRLVHRSVQVRRHASGLRWRLSTYALLALDGGVWGIAGYLVMPGLIPIASLVAAVLACISCIATFGFQVSVPATMAYAAPMLLPTATALVLRGDDFGAVGGGGLVLLLVLQGVTSLAAQQRLTESFWLRVRTQALAKEKDEALRLALHQSAVKSQFLGNVSHELRTPLHGVLGLARLLHLETQDRQSLDRIELIEASGRHLLSLINDLLDISRIEGGRFPLHEENFDLQAQIDHVAGVHRIRATDKGLRFECHLSLPHPCWVIADPARLRQVLHNLLGNAIKFTQAGQVELKVTQTASPEQYLFEVIDTGPGISDASLPKIFQAFEQGDRSISRPLEGAGLGLSIAKEIVQAMGGELRVDTQLGKGSRFSFVARMAPGSAEAAPSSAPSPTHAAQRVRDVPLRILLAEDDDVNAIIATAYIEQSGAVVERAKDGKEAVRRALREVDRPDLILMDCRMPVMDGYTATREIRTQEDVMGLPHLPIVALTATVTDLGRAQCIEAGMNDFLVKPFTPDQLSSALALWLGDSAALPSASPAAKP